MKAAFFTAKRRRGAKLFILGFAPFAGFLLLYLLPTALSVYFSLLDSSFNRVFVGLENYADLWKNRYFRLGLRHLAGIGGAAILVSVSLALGTAWLMEGHPRLAKAAVPILILPLLVPSVSAVKLWQAVFHVNILTPPWLSLMALLTLFAWKFSGVGAVILHAALSRLPREAAEAAALDGAGEGTCFFRIRLPMIAGEFALALVFLLMYFLRIYKECYLLFGQYTAEALYLVQHFMNNQYLNMRAEAVSAAAVTLTLLALALYGGAWAFFGRRRGA